MSVARSARREGSHGSRWLAGLAAGSLLGVPSLAHADVAWVQQAEGMLTCTGQLEPDEVVQLAAPSPSYESPPDRARALEYFQGKTDARHAAYRHLLAISGVIWWANIANDQALRADALDEIRALADAYAKPGTDLLFEQVSRCARAQLASAEAQLGQFGNVALQTTSLLQALPARLPSHSFEDGPLLVAIRELKLAPEARDSLASLAIRAIAYGEGAVAAQQPQRASRLLAAAADALQSLGDAARAKQLATRSLAVTGTPPAVEAAWRAMAPLYDSTLALDGADDAAKLSQLLQPDEPPPTLPDRRSAFESMRRLMRAAQQRGDYATLSHLRVSGFNMLRDVGRDAYSIAFLRHALAGLDSDPDTYDIDLLIANDPSVGPDELATKTSHVETLISKAQSQFVADARQQLYLDYMIDRVMHEIARLYSPMPDSRAQIADATFQLAQLRSFGRLTLATMQAELWKAKVDADTRTKIQLFFAVRTQTAVWLNGILDTVRTAPGSPPPDGEVVGRAAEMLEWVMSMGGNAYPLWTKFVRDNAPGVAELATPRPLAMHEFQRRLRTHEALVATLVTPNELYVWGITSSTVTFASRPVGAEEMAAKVQRLRAGLVPGTANGIAQLPRFDAAAAHELYELVFEPLEPALRGVTDVLWFGHGALGAVPPAVLVPTRPPKPQLATAADFRTTKFLVDRYAFAALADLSLFPWHRDQPLHRDVHAKFLGVGAPLLSEEEVASRSRARSYELAGGLDGRDLAELPKLEESVDELESLATVAGKRNSTLWLGPDASEQNFVDDRLIGYRTIALATHGFLPGAIRDVPEPVLMLALTPDRNDRFDGLLKSSEIARLRLDADLVILSACNTASPDGRPNAEAFTGLSQSFFTAGARALMVSHWPVMSGAAVQLSVGTLERARNSNAPLSRSLQQAMQAVRRSGAASAVESHPSYWGPFVIVGDGR